MELQEFLNKHMANYGGNAIQFCKDLEELSTPSPQNSILDSIPQGYSQLINILKAGLKGRFDQVKWYAEKFIELHPGNRLSKGFRNVLDDKPGTVCLDSPAPQNVDTDENHIMYPIKTVGEVKRDAQNVDAELKDAEIFTWLKSKQYQTERGEQEYTMMYEIDMPKILRAFLTDFASRKMVTGSDEIIEILESLSNRYEVFGGVYAIRKTELDVVIEDLRTKM